MQKIKYDRGHPLLTDLPADGNKDWDIRNPSVKRKPTINRMAAFINPPRQTTFIEPNATRGELDLNRNEPPAKLQDRSLSSKWRYSKLRDKGGESGT